MAELFVKTPAIEVGKLPAGHDDAAAYRRTGAYRLLVCRICAHISLPLLFSRSADNAALRCPAGGLLLEPATAFAALAFYLVEGAAGLPVFTPHGIGGVAQLWPNGRLPGCLIRSWQQSYRGSAAKVIHICDSHCIGSLGNILILLCGSLWLAIYTHADARIVINMAILPFLPGDTLKVISAAALATAWFRLRRFQGNT